MCAFIKIRVTKIFFPVTKSKKDRQIYYQIYKCPLCYFLLVKFRIKCIQTPVYYPCCIAIITKFDI